MDRKGNTQKKVNVEVFYGMSKASAKNTEWATPSFLRCNFRTKPALKMNLTDTHESPEFLQGPQLPTGFSAGGYEVQPTAAMCLLFPHPVSMTRE